MAPKGGNAKKESGRAKKAENEAKKAEAAAVEKVCISFSLLYTYIQHRIPDEINSLSISLLFPRISIRNGKKPTHGKTTTSKAVKQLKRPKKRKEKQIWLGKPRTRVC
jgi:hypothetical protein